MKMIETYPSADLPIKHEARQKFVTKVTKNFLLHKEENRMSGWPGLDESVCNVFI